MGIEVLLSGMAYESNNQSPKYLPMPAACSCQEFRRLANQRASSLYFTLVKGPPAFRRSFSWQSAPLGSLVQQTQKRATGFFMFKQQGPLYGWLERTPAGLLCVRWVCIVMCPSHIYASLAACICPGSSWSASPLHLELTRRWAYLDTCNDRT